VMFSFALVTVVSSQDLFLEQRKTIDSNAELTNKFDKWTEQFDKQYVSIVARREAYAAFVEADSVILRRNGEQLSFQLGHNRFSDLTADVFQATYGGIRLMPGSETATSATMTRCGNCTAAPEVDWVAKGAVTPIKDQGACGSCWAFSTVGAVEGAYQIASGDLLSLSESELVSCDRDGQAECFGGIPALAFDWIHKNGLALESSYPYQPMHWDCYAKHVAPAVVVGGHELVPPNEDALMEAVARQPVSVLVASSSDDFKLYAHGILDSKSCGEDVDHAVLVVGYGSQAGVDYWRIKNSWSSTWGEDGFLRVVRGKNMCGVAGNASYPIGAQSAAPSPPPPPTPAVRGHYQDPGVAMSCEADEIAKSIYFPGAVCAPRCVGQAGSCPTDLPKGVLATPKCLSYDKLVPTCLLDCDPMADNQCGGSMVCKRMINGSDISHGVCLYMLPF